jgi:hypothetical protein
MVGNEVLGQAELIGELAVAVLTLHEGEEDPPTC